MHCFNFNYAAKVGVGLALAGVLLAFPLLPSQEAYAVDTDRDGLSDSYEENYDGNPAYNPFDPISNPTGTDLDKNKVDTDGNGYGDGIEVANPGSLFGEPLNFDYPPPFKSAYQLVNQTSLLSADVSNHRLYPDLSNDGTEIAYIKADPNFANAGLYYIPDIASPVESLLTTLNEFGSQISFGPDGNYIYFSDSSDEGITWDLWRYDLTGSSSEQLTTLSTGQEILDPEVVRYPYSSTLTNKDVLFVSTNGVNGGASEITAYFFVSGVLDIDSPETDGTSIADMEGVWAGSEMFPKVNASGDTLLFATVKSATDIKTYIVIEGLEDILLGNTGTITNPFTDNRADYAGYTSVPNFPIGFSPTGKVFYAVADMNDNYSGDLDFSLTDFDLFVGSIRESGSILRTRIPMEGNQYSGAVSIDGTQIIVSSDNDFTNDTMANLFAAGVETLNRVAWFESQLQGGFTMEDPSGVRLDLPNLIEYTLPGASPNGTIKISSLSLEERPSGPSDVEVIRTFEPDGMTFDTAGATLTTRYLDKDFTQEQEDAGLDVLRFEEGGSSELLPTLSRDTTSNTITSSISGFSSVGVVSLADGGSGGNPLDEDADQLPDVWELNYGISPATGLGDHGRDGDLDNDGITNWIEFVYGTDPDNITNFPTSGDTTGPLYVDFDYDGVEQGTSNKPFNTIFEGALHVIAGQDISISPGQSSEGIRITKRTSLLNNGGASVRIGVATGKNKMTLDQIIGGFFDTLPGK